MPTPRLRPMCHSLDDRLVPSASPFVLHLPSNAQTWDTHTQRVIEAAVHYALAMPPLPVPQTIPVGPDGQPLPLVQPINFQPLLDIPTEFPGNTDYDQYLEALNAYRQQLQELNQDLFQLGYELTRLQQWEGELRQQLTDLQNEIDGLRGEMLLDGGGTEEQRCGYSASKRNATGRTILCKASSTEWSKWSSDWVICKSNWTICGTMSTSTRRPATRRTTRGATRSRCLSTPRCRRKTRRSSSSPGPRTPPYNPRVTCSPPPR